MSYRTLLMAIDGIVIGLAFLLAFVLRNQVLYTYVKAFEALYRMPAIKDVVWLGFLTVAAWIMSLFHFGMYDSMRKRKFSDLFRIIFEASLFAVLMLSAVALLLKLSFPLRVFLGILLVCAVSLLFIEKSVVLSVLHVLRQRGFNSRVILMVGSGSRAKKFSDIIDSHPHWGFKILGFIDVQDRVGVDVGNYKVIGSFDDLASVIDHNVVDDVVFVLPRRLLGNLEDRCIEVCEKVGIKVTIAADLFDTSIGELKLAELHGWPVLTLDTTPRDPRCLVVKRALDILVSAIGLAVLSPVFALFAMMIKVTSPGPVFFTQTRCGLRGRKFTIYKFRTMVVDAEKRLDDLKKFNEREGPVFKMKNDPRVTSVGRLLRKTSLDELPQLINVLKGEMSLIGPRPPIPSEVERYERWHRRRLSLRPGIACIHEVVARGDNDFEKWMKMDLEYIDNWSLALDFKILQRMVRAVIRGTGC